jgi:phospho-N-acetylmuramoyl-pentapeptide-transferase
MGILLITKSVLLIMCSFLFSIALGFILIPILNKKKFGQNISSYLSKEHSKKQGIPTMGGLIFIIPTLVITLLLILIGKIKLTSDLMIIIITFLSYALIGGIDDYLSLKKKNNEGLTTISKFTLQFIVGIILFFLYLQAGGSTFFQVSTLGIKVNLGWLYGPFILLILVGSSNAVNLTDGLDGLAASLSIVAFIAFGLISMVVGKIELAFFIMLLFGSILGFLVFNVYPAKIFMGDIGSLSIGAVMGMIAILTHKELTLLVVAGVFVVETISVILQNFWMYFFHRKLFLMTPLHHNLEKKGWMEPDIVKFFLVIGFILSMAGIYYGVWL